MMSVFQQAASDLGIGLANKINMLHPEIVVLGGALLRSHERFFETAVEIARKNIISGIPARLYQGQVEGGRRGHRGGVDVMEGDAVSRLERIGDGGPLPRNERASLRGGTSSPEILFNLMKADEIDGDEMLRTGQQSVLPFEEIPRLVDLFVIVKLLNQFVDQDPASVQANRLGTVPVLFLRQAALLRQIFQKILHLLRGGRKGAAHIFDSCGSNHGIVTYRHISTALVERTFMCFWRDIQCKIPFIWH